MKTTVRFLQTTRYAAVAVLMLSFLACGGPQERKAQYRAKAQDYIEVGDFSKGRVALRNVLKIDPKDAEAYYLVAQVEENCGAMAFGPLAPAQMVEIEGILGR